MKNNILIRFLVAFLYTLMFTLIGGKEEMTHIALFISLVTYGLVEICLSTLTGIATISGTL